MNSGGDILKLFFSLLAILLTSSLLLLFSNSFTNAEIKNDATLSIVPEDSALIAIIDWEGRTFSIKNNTEETVEIAGIELSSDSDMDIEAGEIGDFTLVGDAEELSGKVIEIIAHWNGGSAEIKSTIPEFTENEVVPVLEVVNADTVPEADLETDEK